MLTTKRADLIRHLGLKTPRFSLRYHLTVMPVSRIYGPDDLDVMEEEGYFPPTASWINCEGLKVKLYEGSYVGNFTLGNLEIRSGGLEIIQLPQVEDRVEAFRCTGDRSMLATKPRALPKKTLELFRVLDLLQAL